jgi:hypothetical protein
VATAHVAQHAYGAAYYALKAVAARAGETKVGEASEVDEVEARVRAEWAWQAEQLPETLQNDMRERVIVQKKGRKVQVKIQKGEGF